MKQFTAVYRIYCTITNKNYIGISINPEGRINAHANSPYPIGCAIRKYGWKNFEVDILHFVETRKEACRLEIKEIARYNSFGSKGYNLTKGGDNPPCLYGKDNAMSNSEHRAKAVAGIKKYHQEHPNIWKGKNASRYGSHPTEETKTKLRKPKSKKHKNNLSKAAKISQNRPEVKVKKSIAMKGKKNSVVSESNRRRKGEKRPKKYENGKIT